MREYLGNQVRASPFGLELTSTKSPTINSCFAFFCSVSFFIFSLWDMAYTDWSSPLYLMVLQMLKVASSLFNRNFICPFSISTKALLVARNGLPRIIGTSKSTSQSRITKSLGNMNESIFTYTSWSMSIGLFTVRSTISSRIAVGFGSPNLTSCKSRGA